MKQLIVVIIIALISCKEQKNPIVNSNKHEGGSYSIIVMNGDTMLQNEQDTSIRVKLSDNETHR